MSEVRFSERDLKIIFKYMVGRPVEEIARQEGISTSTLYRVLKQYNIPLKTEKEAREYFRRKIFNALVNEKKTIVEISRELGLDSRLVNGYVRYEYDQIAKEEEKKKVEKKKLKQEGLKGLLPSSNRKGLNISRTQEEQRKIAEFERNEKSVKVTGEELVDLYDDFTEEEKAKLSFLREMLKYASIETNMTDYSEDPLLLPDYFLPIDIVIMKDMVARSVEGETVEKIASNHRTDVELVSDLVDKGLDRTEFRDRFIKSLIRRGLIQI